MVNGVSGLKKMIGTNSTTREREWGLTKHGGKNRQVEPRVSGYDKSHVAYFPKTLLNSDNPILRQGNEQRH
jgi:hypothetical protein